MCVPFDMPQRSASFVGSRFEPVLLGVTVVGPAVLEPAPEDETAAKKKDPGAVVTVGGLVKLDVVFESW